MTMCNQYMFIFNSKYSSYSLWDGVMRGRLRWLGESLSMEGGPTGAGRCLPQERASLASWVAPSAHVWKVPGGASKLPSRAQLAVSLGTRAPVGIPIPSRLLPGGAEAALWATLERDESR